METFEVKYFLAVAETQSVRKAAESIGISSSAVSKAISRLESELEVKLTEKVGRNIRLTPSGKLFANQGAEFLALERSIADSHNPLKSKMELTIVGPELLLSNWGPLVMEKVVQKYPLATIKFKIASNESSVEMVKNYSANFALIASSEKRTGKMSKKIAEIRFKIFAAKRHRLAKKLKVSAKEISLERFAMTNSSAQFFFLNLDLANNWNEDKFQHRNVIFTESLKTLESILVKGLAISYLPDFYGEQLGLKALNTQNSSDQKKNSIYLVRNKYGLDNLWP